MKINEFEKDYSQIGFKAQREYPNTDLISFIKSSNTYKNINRKKIKVLEVGCGSGSNLWMLSKENFDTYGLDISETGLQLCKKMLKKWNVNAKLSIGSMTDLPFSKGFFDLIIDVVSMQNLNFEEHLLSWNSINHCLKQNGLFFSIHLGKKTSSYQDLKKNKSHLVDKQTLKNIPKNYPLAHRGAVCFLNKTITTNALISLGFKNINIENNIKSYNNQSQLVEYLTIKAAKSASK